MAWQTEMPTLLRYVINDSESPQEFTDARLERLITSSAQLTLGVVDFPRTYVVDVAASGITPDPTSAPRDNGFINLVILKAACLLSTGDYRKSSNKGLIIKDGPSSIDARTLVESKRELMESLCKDYNEAELEFRLGNSNAGAAILGPHRTDIAGGSSNNQTEFN